MSAAEQINTDSVLKAPSHIAKLFNEGHIDWETLCEKTAVYYLEELNKAEHTKNELASELRIYKSLVVDKNPEISEVRAELQDQTTLKLSVASARSELTELKPRLAELESLEALNTELTKELSECKRRVDSLTQEASKLVAVSHELDSAKEVIGKYKVDCDSLSAQLRVAREKTKNLTAQLENAQRSTTGNLGRQNKLEKDLAESKRVISAYKADVESKNALLKDMNGQVKDALETVESMRVDSKQAVDVIEALDEKNRILSLYVNAHSTAPMLATEHGELRVCMIDQKNIVNSKGKEPIQEDTALFYWFSPCGFGCMVALSDAGHSGNDRLIVMPAFEHDEREKDQNVDRIIRELEGRVCPPEHLYDQIIDHIKNFSPKEFKRSMCNAFARADFLEKKLGVSEDEKIIATVTNIQQIHKRLKALESPLRTLLNKGKKAKRAKSMKSGK
ncbi:hypothetical protein MHM93_14455 [Pseudoalteromonas sp. MM17-2]|uniref:hypothetical protein n=1 Tax=Pseudoalteromonas sp. MM17-2 TaxID=2917753 RepID=UPI001EF732D7|nr:hypothetical protein [Pseudoalteromonas sp. MM17-2]MCG7545379.1 hypothetical protein [Pseudoalteromonas sp. MM17-2]